MQGDPNAIYDSEIAELAPRIRRRDVSVTELVDAFLQRIDRLGGGLNCFISVRDERAREEAIRLDAELARGAYRGPLHGVPISVKDNICLAGEPTTAGSTILRGWLPPEDAPVIKQLREAGAVVLAKCNMDEFAHGAPHPSFGAPRNPWGSRLSCDGSSSGSAAAVAAGLCAASIGTDTSGSIRIPAALCGVVGLKPTRGIVSCRGVVPVSRTLDHVGPLARTLGDCGAILAASVAAHGRNERDQEADFACLVERDPAVVRLGVLSEQALRSAEPQIRSALESVSAHFAAAGADVVEISLPDLELAQVSERVISGAEAAEYHHDNLRTHAASYGPAVRLLLEVGELLPAPAYVRARRVRTQLASDMQAALSVVDAVLLPTVPLPAYRIGQRAITIDGEAEPVLEAITRYTALSALTGHPAVSFPCGASDDGRPLAAQLVGHPHRDLELLGVARCYERSTPWHERRPPPVAAQRVTQVHDDR